MTLDDARQILNDNFAPWVLDLGLQVQALTEGPQASVTLRLPTSPRLARVGGILCGQAIMAAADTASVLAFSAACGGFRPMTTVQLQTSFMRPVMAVDALVTARVLRVGKTMGFGEILIRPDGREDLAAHATTTYAML